MLKRASVPVAVLSVVMPLCPACVDVPSAPAPQADLSADYAAYDHPTATLTESNVRTMVTALGPSASAISQAGSFALVRQLVDESSTALASEAPFLDEVAVAGVAHARLPCVIETTAATTEPPPLPASKGIALEVGVENSAIQRVLSGSVAGCPLTLFADMDGVLRVTADADLLVDLGGNLALGDALTSPTLVRASNVRAIAASAAIAKEVTGTSYEVRVTTTNGVEVLVDPSTVGVAVKGTMVLVFETDGTVRFRDRNGFWTCTGGHTPCTFGK